MGSFASPKRFAHYGLPSNVATLSYEPKNVRRTKILYRPRLYSRPRFKDDFFFLVYDTVFVMVPEGVPALRMLVDLVRDKRP